MQSRKVYVSKFALDRGIELRVATVRPDGTALTAEKRKHLRLSPNEFAMNWEDALVQAKRIRDEEIEKHETRIAELETRIAELETLEFKHPGARRR